jgi:hypothetical protein
VLSAIAVFGLRLAALFGQSLGTLPLRSHRLARSHIACVTFIGFGTCAFFRSACRLQMLSLLTDPAESSRGALWHPGFGLSGSAPRLHPPWLPSRLTSRSSRRRVVASLKLPGMRAILAPIRCVRRGLTPALGPHDGSSLSQENADVLEAG